MISALQRTPSGGAGLIKELKRVVPGQLRDNVPLAPMTTFRCSAAARAVFSPRNLEALVRALRWFAEVGVRPGAGWSVIGRGSNLLVRDGGYPGVLIDLSEGFTRIEGLRETESFRTVRAEGGVANGELLRWLRQRKLGGFGFSFGIPGTVGGGIRMNAGTPLGSFSRIVKRVEGVDSRGVALATDVTENDFAYRDFPKGRDLVVTAGVFDFPKREDAAVAGEIERAKAGRANQPLDLPNVGSVFKNPEGDYAGRLIEACGLKGFRIGDVQISPRHANFIVNVGKGKTADALAVIEHARRAVREAFGVELEPEVHVIGEEA